MTCVIVYQVGESDLAVGRLYPPLSTLRSAAYYHSTPVLSHPFFNKFRVRIILLYYTVSGYGSLILMYPELAAEMKNVRNVKFIQIFSRLG